MVGAFAFYGMIEFLPDWYRVKVGRKGYVRYKQTDMMAFFNTISKNDVVFLTPLIVATAPLSLPYILLGKTSRQPNQQPLPARVENPQRIYARYSVRIEHRTEITT